MPQMSVVPAAAQGPSHAELLLRRWIAVDLEVSRQGRLLELGAVIGDATLAVRHPQDVGEGLKRLAELARTARGVLGHNILRHDLPRLHDIVPEHPVHSLPVIDTLVLSPLAFPKNPYHRLLKDNKLVRESLSDPVADARQAAALLVDEWRAFDSMSRTDPPVFEALRGLLVTAAPPADGLDAGMREFFEAWPGPGWAAGEVAARLHSWLQDRACSTALRDPPPVAARDDRLAFAYAVAWLNVAGTDSVLPPWVRHAHPETSSLIRRWRDIPCASDACAYCRRVHNAQEQLRQYFRFDDFRPGPSDRPGRSLQREIVQAGMRDESLLAILPTGGGKSLCFQLPAIVRNYRRGVLTIVISPLQALMKDQVDGLVRRTGAPFAAALYGMLTPPERGAVLRRVALGNIAILYVSPEQLRNRSFQSAIAQREIGCWVFDEAHCLSKWGHDFRPDYLYAARFIREFSMRQQVEPPSIACFTATARREVQMEILEHFRTETGRSLKVFEGGVERDNLEFEVESTSRHAKLDRVHDWLSEHLRAEGSGAAVVFRSRRELTATTAAYLVERGWKAAHFHAGLIPSEKKRIQDEFLSGATQVICATNAFGMGIDKDDVRLVIHADTPGSLENYLQEAGRAGRDGRRALCVLLYDDLDCDDQFRLGAQTELSRQDLAGILRTVRRAVKAGRDEVVITAGEILRDEASEAALSLHERNADTQVRTAVAWLERAGFLQRNENVTSVFQAQLVVRSLDQAMPLIERLNLPAHEQSLWLAILRSLINADPTEPLTVDRLALLPEFEAMSGWSPVKGSPDHASVRILRILQSMEEAGLVRRDTRLNAYVRHKVVDHSRLRLERCIHAERCMLDALQEADPEPEGWLPLSLRLLNERLVEAGCESSVELLRTLLRSLSEDGRGFAGSRGSLDLRFIAQDAYRVRVARNWSAVQELSRRRQRVAEVVLDCLSARIAADQPPRADLLVEFGFEELRDAMDRDAALRSDLRDADAALERALMYMHENRVIVLQQGLAIFRSAMTLQLLPERQKDGYRGSDYQPLRDHYRERTLQVHVMAEYARRGLQRIQDAHALVLGYFTLGKDVFLKRFFTGRTELLEHATTAQSFQQIVTDLNNTTQARIVGAPLDRNLLVLAGPGSGKTRTVVHRCAYLLRVKRVPARSILVCCFNRHAALEVRRRLRALAGDDAHGVLVQTYHGLALRLLGRSLSARETIPDEHANGQKSSLDFDSLIHEAVSLLEARNVPAGLEPDEIRDRLLAGFRHILVDEYQDIDEFQYALISAIAGRRVADADQKLSIMAVGDDDQNIYSFRGTHVRFIRKFQEDYGAEVYHLVENYRSTRYLIDASNQVIARASARMKTGHPIRIDSGRELLPAGGELGRVDRELAGRVLVIPVAGVMKQAHAVLDEIGRLRFLHGAEPSRFAVLGEKHRDLHPIRALLEREGLPVRWLASRVRLPLPRVREIRRVMQWLRDAPERVVPVEALKAQIPTASTDAPCNPWLMFLNRHVEALCDEMPGTELDARAALEFLHEACAEERQAPGHGHGITVGTVHAAKGTEYDHVLLVGAWVPARNPDEVDALRRAFYVGMTRARHTLAVIHHGAHGASLAAELEGPAVQRRSWVPSSAGAGDAGRFEALEYEETGLEDIVLGYPGWHGENHPVHAALARLETGSSLRLESAAGDTQWHLVDADGVRVARMSHAWVARSGAWRDRVRDVRVTAMIHRDAEQDPDPVRREKYRVTSWEIPVVEFALAERG